MREFLRILVQCNIPSWFIATIFYLYIFATQCERSFIFQTMHFVRSISLSLKYPRSKEIVSRKRNSSNFAFLVLQKFRIFSRNRLMQIFAKNYFWGQIICSQNFAYCLLSFRKTIAKFRKRVCEIRKKIFAFFLERFGWLETLITWYSQGSLSAPSF